MPQALHLAYAAPAGTHLGTCLAGNSVCLDAQQNDLLRAAFAIELLELSSPPSRATQLRECVVAAPTSEEADRYLDEATAATLWPLHRLRRHVPFRP